MLMKYDNINFFQKKQAYLLIKDKSLPSKLRTWLKHKVAEYKDNIKKISVVVISAPNRYVLRFVLFTYRKESAVNYPEILDMAEADYNDWDIEIEYMLRCEAINQRIQKEERRLSGDE